MDNHSHDYTVVRLDRERGESWKLLPDPSLEVSQAPTGPEDTPEEGADVAFEHRESGAIISLNSACREYHDESLQELSHFLLMGLNARGEAKNREIKLDGARALESEVDAWMTQRKPSGESTDLLVRVRAVVLRKSGCTYDLMYIARPQVFDDFTSHFERFLKGFHVR